MSAIAITPTSTITYFEQAMRSQLEARAELKDREIEIREMKAQKTMNDRIVEELRPLCEELSGYALDPVMYEPIKTPLVMRCSHALSAKAVEMIGKTKGFTMDDKIPCPICRSETTGRFFLYDQSFDETVGCVEKFP